MTHTDRLRFLMVAMAWWAMVFYWITVMFPIEMNPPGMLLDYIVSILLIDRLILWLPHIGDFFNEPKD